MRTCETPGIDLDFIAFYIRFCYFSHTITHIHTQHTYAHCRRHHTPNESKIFFLFLFYIRWLYYNITSITCNIILYEKNRPCCGPSYFYFLSCSYATLFHSQLFDDSRNKIYATQPNEIGKQKNTISF